MHDDDQPTVPTLPPYGTGRTPSWPRRGERAHDADQRFPLAMSPVLLGVSLGANVVLLLGVLGLLLLGRARFFAPSAPTPGTSPSPVALSSPTATANPQPQGGWLQVAPSSVTLGCTGDQRHQFIVLVNTGPQPVQWQAALSLPQEQAGVTVSPNQGQLNAGASMPLQIQSQPPAPGAQGSATQQGEIRFTPLAPAAGPTPSVRYTAVSCP